MTAYLIAHLTVTDTEAFLRYETEVGAVLDRYRGVVRARAGAPDGLRGDPTIQLEGNLTATQRHMIVEFPDAVSAQSFYDSDDYADLKRLRHAGSVADAIIVVGIAGTPPR